MLAGIILTAVTVVTCASVIGRNTTGWTLLGDYELTAVAAGAAIALFMPWCQIRRQNIIVDFFTARASSGVNARLDRFGALLLAAMFLVLAWRTATGGLNARSSMTTTMMLVVSGVGTLIHIYAIGYMRGLMEAVAADAGR